MNDGKPLRVTLKPRNEQEKKDKKSSPKTEKPTDGEVKDNAHADNP